MEEKQMLDNVFPPIQQVYTANQPILNEWTNHSSFYAIYPSYYYTFANQWLRKWLAWFDGYVPGIHDGQSGIISTRLATTLCYRLAEQVYGGGLLYSANNDTKKSRAALKFISTKWSEEAEFPNQALKAFVLSGAGGTSYAKLNVAANKEAWVDTWRADQCYADFDFRGKVIRAEFLIAKYTKTVPNQAEKNENFFIVEERFFANNQDNKKYKENFKNRIEKLDLPINLEINKPYVSYKVYRMQGTVSDFNQVIDRGRALNWEEIPQSIKNSIIDSYGTIQLNVPQRLPFISLGVYAFKWTPFISNLPQLPFGESLIARIQGYLFEYDFMNSCMNTDFYLGRGRVLVPKSLQSPKPINLNGISTPSTYNSGLDSFLFTKVEYASTEDKKPEAIQFDLRSNDWLTSRNHLLECIATAIGISPSTIASFLQDSSARTAREISSEESATALFVENRRKLFAQPINELIKDVLLFYGYEDTITVKFSKSGQTNTTLVTENTVSAYNARLISQYQAVKNLNPDMNEEELQAEIDRINNDEEKLSNIQSKMQFDDDSGGFGDQILNKNNEDVDESEEDQGEQFELASEIVGGGADSNQSDNKASNNRSGWISKLFKRKKENK